jgi:large subunit ribosomal protein L29
MKITKELRNLSTEELNNRLVEFRKEILKMNVQVASGANVQNPGKFKLMKKNVARILTLLKEKGAKDKN